MITDLTQILFKGGTRAWQKLATDADAEAGSWTSCSRQRAVIVRCLYGVS